MSEHHAATTSTRSDLDRIGLQHRRSGRIDVFSAPQYRGLEVRILDRLCNDQVNLPAEDPRQLILQTEEISKSIITTRLEINKKVNVAGMGIEMIGKYRPENTQSSNTEPGACLRQRLGINRHFNRHRTILSEPRNDDQRTNHVGRQGGRRPGHLCLAYRRTYLTARR